MQKMTNAVQNYAWGSHDALTRLYGIANPDNQPMAELWMGAHPRALPRAGRRWRTAFAARANR